MTRKWRSGHSKVRTHFRRITQRHFLPNNTALSETGTGCFWTVIHCIISMETAVLGLSMWLMFRNTLIPMPYFRWAHKRRWRKRGRNRVATQVRNNSCYLCNNNDTFICQTPKRVSIAAYCYQKFPFWVIYWIIYLKVWGTDYIYYFPTSNVRCYTYYRYFLFISCNPKCKVIFLFIPYNSKCPL